VSKNNHLVYCHCTGTTKVAVKVMGRKAGRGKHLGDLGTRTKGRDRPKFRSSLSQWITECNTTSARLIVCLKNTPAKNTLVQLLALYTDPERHSAQRYRQTDGQHDDANSRSCCVAVQSAKNLALLFFCHCVE